jgi:predicted acylesterase/phospholipase RssA
MQILFTLAPGRGCCAILLLVVARQPATQDRAASPPEIAMRFDPFTSVLLARCVVAVQVMVLSGCSLFSHTNVELAPTIARAPGVAPLDPKLALIAPVPPAAPTAQIVPANLPSTADAAPLPIDAAGHPLRATFKINGQRGNPEVLFFLALSGGGSRAAYLSTATMIKLQTVFEDVDLLREVDVMSSVSGGSVAAAYYAVTRDAALDLVGPLVPVLAATDAELPSAKLRVDRREKKLTCAAPLDAAEQDGLRRLMPAPVRGAAQRVIDLCEQAPLALRTWNKDAPQMMQRDFLLRWFGNWFWPTSIAKYWFTAYDRADIMAQTLADNLYDVPVTGRDFRFKDLNPQRPYLIINATNATEQVVRPNDPVPEEFAFGSVFTFTDEDFKARLQSDLREYSVARAVMASSAFPLVFPSMTLRDYRAQYAARCNGAAAASDAACSEDRYLHVFDGGNSDNLGLRSIKRALFELAARGELGQYKKVVVLLVDAFTKPRGTPRSDSDPRNAVSFLFDTNVVDAVDSLLFTNRARLIGEFRNAQLRWNEGECDDDARNLPKDLCARLDERFERRRVLSLPDKLVFYHLGFKDVGDAEDGTLKTKLDSIPTSFRLGRGAAGDIDRAVALLLTDRNACLQQVRRIVLGEPVKAEEANEICRRLSKENGLAAGE